MEGITNGELIRRISAQFDILISHDAGLPYQQNWKALPLCLVLVKAASNRLVTYEGRLPTLLEAIASAVPGEVRIVDLTEADPHIG